METQLTRAVGLGAGRWRHRSGGCSSNAPLTEGEGDLAFLAAGIGGLLGTIEDIAVSKVLKSNLGYGIELGIRTDRKV